MDTPRNEKINVRIRWNNDDPQYLLLSENEIAFLEWLEKHEYLDSETSFKINSEEPVPIEF